ncbi:MBL fold metallo-hydrolase [Erythrobacter sp. THAF29]|uniref:MBL fold metallo-hydrolase n=1 Tax=Erythrobacter sp. THAF29 TaxID=2587851 RepID=UPI0012697D71|nr:MBL fold metallo-hydrolase [Erythrobacter sp. THAF29]QFT76890.1 putative polyketide biosynthesis zinc-dependent hydrolase BaeB [Erythrobacter sp. THAF29]
MAGIPPKPWPTGEAEQVEPLVKRVLAPNPSPYTYTGTQTYVVGQADGPDCAVIDPGPNEADHIEAIMAAVGDAKVLAIMCTHTHRDHSPAAAPLAERTGAPVVGCAPLAIKTDLPRSDEAFDTTYAPDRVLEDGEQMRGTGWTLTAVATPGHTSNHLCFALEESGALFTGDHVMGWSTSVVIPPDGDMGDYMSSLEKLQARDDVVYHSAHGAAITNPRQLVRGMIGHRRQRENQILRLMDEAPRAVSEFIPDMYKGLDKRLVPAAEMSVTAHLIDLERRGLAGRSLEAGVEVWRTN